MTKKPEQPIQFMDLVAQRARMGQALEDAVLSAIRDGKYILGPQVDQLEKQLCVFSGAKHAITCANGTDAIGLVLAAKKVGPGDAVFVPAFTFVATAEVVAWRGATPFFVDVEEDSFNIDTNSLNKAIQNAKDAGLTPRGVIAVDLFGLPANYPAIHEIAEKQDLWIVADAAQSFGAASDGKKVGTLTTVTTTSFFPAKPLGCYGDGGAIFTNDDALADELKSLRFHGKGEDKYDNIRIGLNSRLDTVQAAVLLEKMKIFDEEIAARQVVANRYTEGLSDLVKTPTIPENMKSVWAQYTIILSTPEMRPSLMDICKNAGIPTMVYYPIPLAQQKAYAHYPSVDGGTPVSDRLAKTVMSLPMHPYMKEDVQNYIIEVVREGLVSLRESTASRKQAAT